MGYDSYGRGKFKLRKGLSLEKVLKFNSWAEDKGFEIDGGEGMSITFCEFRMYNAEPLFKELSTYVDGEFDIEGEENDDIWKMILKDGQIYERKSTITFGEPTLKESW